MPGINPAARVASTITCRLNWIQKETMERGTGQEEGQKNVYDILKLTDGYTGRAFTSLR